ncbi:undecaprenyl-diphosphate phosphatase [Verrucomicrobia bacterium LW23]|nr:undecaprenyl-diphosphate phosphatase [Verrucomicrobia bacterium LW23]
MWDILVVVLMGVVEGVTEFLPVSSTGHLLLVQYFMGEGRPEVFNVVIQFGAIIAVVMIYWQKLVDLAVNLRDPSRMDYVLKLGVAFGFTVVPMLILKKMGLELSHNPWPIAMALVFGALAIFGAEMLLARRPGEDNITWTTAVVVGLSQVVAGVFPGTSRSAATIIGAMLVGRSRPAATEFSFLIGIPTMFAASAYDLYKARNDPYLTSGHGLFEIALGFAVSCAVAFVVVKWLLKYVQSNTFLPFAWYRLIVGDVLLLALWMGWM